MDESETVYMGEEDTQKPDPFIKWDHPVGPTLICHDGAEYHLTKQEILFARVGLLNLTAMDRRHNNEPRRG